jgi:dihydroneopterin aldolase
MSELQGREPAGVELDPVELDRVELLGLRARGRHGVLTHERALGQDFVVDVVLHLDTRPAAAADDLTLTVDYGTLAEGVVAVVAGEPVDLIETLAQRIADVALAPAAVHAVDVRVHKPQAPVSVPVDDVVVAIHRERR